MFSNDQFLERFADSAGMPFGDPADREAVAAKVMDAHAVEIADYLHILWDATRAPGRPPLPTTPIPTSTHFSRAVLLRRSSAEGPSAWFHLIYAYLLENTRMFEIFSRVIAAFNDGESLGVASSASQQWLATTEALFYRQQTAHDHTAPTALTSDVRDDGRAIRRNAYYRMFGIDLNHGTEDNKPYPYKKPKIANAEVFVDALESLLRELWIAIMNESTTTANPTDAGAIEDLTRRLFVMLTNRRTNGTLTPQEFSAVATLDWLRLAVTYDSAIVQDLRATASSEAERLHKIAERVALPAHGKSDEYFYLASPLSVLLRGIELQNLTNVTDFLQPAVRPLVALIITKWSSATGKLLKGRPVRSEAAA